MRPKDQPPEPRVAAATAPFPNLMLFVIGGLLALGVWGTVFEGWRSGVIRDLLIYTPFGDKVGHFLVYGVLALVFGWLGQRRLPQVAWIIGPTVAWFLGFADEVRQIGLMGRDAGFPDLIANTLGVALAAYILYRRRDVHARDESLQFS